MQGFDPGRQTTDWTMDRLPAFKFVLGFVSHGRGDSPDPDIILPSCFASGVLGPGSQNALAKLPLMLFPYRGVSENRGLP